MELNINILLEFLYNRFAITFLFCLAGSWIRAAFRKPKKDESKKLDIKRVVTSTLFSTFLMCACAEYIELSIGIYAGASVLCGMWGISIIQVVMSENFILVFISNLTKKVADPIVKSTMETVSQVSKEKNKKGDTNKDNTDDKKE